MSKPRQWIYDRSNGESKGYGDSHPPLAICFAPPCVKYCPQVMEENKFCVTVGKLGTQNDKVRYWLTRVGLITNLIGFVLTVYSCFSISNNYSILQWASFSAGTISPIERPDNYMDIQDATVHLGLRGIAINDPSSAGEEVVPFSEVCEYTGSPSLAALSSYLVDPDSCDVCNEYSAGLVISMIMSVVTYIPTLSTDVLRMFPNYDVNCQKTCASVISIITLILSINTLLNYSTSCFESFYEGLVGIDENGDVLESDSMEPAAITLLWDWSAGSGFTCLVIATCSKVIDIICHFIIATPTITRDLKEQEEYEEKYGKPANNKNENNNDEEQKGSLGEGEEEEMEKSKEDKDHDNTPTKENEAMAA